MQPNAHKKQSVDDVVAWLLVCRDVSILFYGPGPCRVCKLLPRSSASRRRSRPGAAITSDSLRGRGRGGCRLPVPCRLWHSHARCINLNNKSHKACPLAHFQMPPRRRCAMSICSSSRRRCDAASRWRCAASISWMVHRSIRLSFIAASWSFIASRPANIPTRRSFSIPASKWTYVEPSIPFSLAPTWPIQLNTDIIAGKQLQRHPGAHT